MRRANAIGAVMSGLGLLAGACGVPTDERAHVVDVPGNVSETPIAEQPSEGPGRTIIYLVSGSKVVPVVRTSAASCTIDRVRYAVESLERGPLADEALTGLSNAVVDLTMTIRGSITAGEAVIDIGDVGEEVPTNQQPLAYAQIVATVTAQPGVDRVTLVERGTIRRALAGNGTAIEQPLTRDSYKNLIANQALASSLTAQIVLEQNGKLVYAARDIDRHEETVADAQALLDALVAGPRVDERRDGMRSVLGSLQPPARTRSQIVVNEISDGLAVVDLGAAYETMPDGERARALAAIVATLTSLPGVGGVRLLANGQRLANVPVASGALFVQPARRDYFKDILPVEVCGRKR